MIAKPSILIVDDNQGDVEIASFYLERSGLYSRVYSVSDGQEAFDLFEQWDESQQRLGDAFPPTLILLDINMPRMNGFEFLEALAKLPIPKPAPVVVVMLTSSEFGPDRERAEENPLVRDYLTKPLTREGAVSLAEEYGVRRCTKA